ncbi:MAG: L-2-amino-thiazoline-4-carboxylic acid hydrolase [Candidatus Tectomicrobia bacterium]|nr:L-2-amino-thiazoline-4-carboxylic acid hydrolase [Candidatus Tectomicrobia bacterium]
MSSQQANYYTTRKAELLEDFDNTADLVKDTVISRYGADFANSLYRACRDEYEDLIPHIPYIAGFRARALNTFLVISAQELAVYKGMKTYGKTAAEAWQICHDALRLRMTHYSPIKRWLLKRVMFSGMLKRRFQQRAEAGEIHHLGDFQVRFVSGHGEDFDFGVDYMACGIHNFVRDHGGEEFAPYVCLSDIALSDAMDWGLIRTETLADGCKRCDFRFKQGGTTQISSNLPEVQKTIDHIARKEMETSALQS